MPLFKVQKFRIQNDPNKILTIIHPDGDMITINSQGYIIYTEQGHTPSSADGNILLSGNSFNTGIRLNINAETANLGDVQFDNVRIRKNKFGEPVVEPPGAYEIYLLIWPEQEVFSYRLPTTGSSETSYKLSSMYKPNTDMNIAPMRFKLDEYSDKKPLTEWINKHIYFNNNGVMELPDPLIVIPPTNTTNEKIQEAIRELDGIKALLMSLMQ
jgi:hypothetical protein